ncbi:MAG: chlorophyll a/b-binding protein [Calothrix sp. MO_167.B42]|nr:chlorophyll a/b-binding protein [Calothrix sp. MO_167.B42]
MQDKVKASAQFASDRNAWRWGFTPQAEIWNGRLAMLGFFTATILELLFGEGFLHLWSAL